MRPLANIMAVVLDSADPPTLADFYQKATNWDIVYEDDVFVYLGKGKQVKLGFERVDGYQAPPWPAAAKNVHLDFQVPDTKAAESELIALGASRSSYQPGDGQWTVMIDPEGHPFCITRGFPDGD